MRCVRYVIMVREAAALRLEQNLDTVRRTMLIGPPGQGELVMDLVAITSDEYAPIMARHSRHPFRCAPVPLRPRRPVIHLMNVDPDDPDHDHIFTKCCRYNQRSVLEQGDMLTAVLTAATCQGR